MNSTDDNLPCVCLHVSWMLPVRGVASTHHTAAALYLLLGTRIKRCFSLPIVFQLMKMWICYRWSLPIVCHLMTAASVGKEFACPGISLPHCNTLSWGRSHAHLKPSYLHEIIIKNVQVRLDLFPATSGLSSASPPP